MPRAHRPAEKIVLQHATGEFSPPPKLFRVLTDFYSSRSLHDFVLQVGGTALTQGLVSAVEERLVTFQLELVTFSQAMAQWICRTENYCTNHLNAFGFPWQCVISSYFQAKASVNLSSIMEYYLFIILLYKSMNVIAGFFHFICVPRCPFDRKYLKFL